jgi:hypothetical protein
MIVNIKILTNDGKQIDYIKAEDLNIRMNRVADDLQNIEARYGEFSYSFSLPMTRNNQEIFGFAGIRNVKNIFKVNPIEIKVFNNDLLLLSGQLELQKISGEMYECVFYSKLTQLTDELRDKNMNEITICPQIDWNYEITINSHITAGYLNSDQTPYQFPLMFYNTYYCPTSVFSGLTDTIVDANGTTNHVFQRDRSWQNWYYLLNHTSVGLNEMYHHQIPLAFYLKSMMEYMFTDIGWGIGGSFWEDANIKKIIVPYVGDTDVYDRACYCTDGSSITGSTCLTGTLKLDTSQFMPDMPCLDFLSNVINLFNLYLMIDVNNKIILFETYDVMFGSKIAPYNIDNKILGKTVVSRVEDYNPSISFETIENQRILGDNRYIASSGTSAYNAKYLITKNKNLFNSVFNHIGETEGEIKIGFGAPAVKTMRIRNDYDINNVPRSAGDTVMFLPFISKQLPEDNGNKPFNKNDNETIVYNTEETIQYNGKIALYYYYGVSNSNLLQKTPLISYQSLYFYINLDDINQKIPFSSPFALTAYRDIINQTLNEAGLNPTGSTDSADTMLASYMQSIYLMMASGSSVSNTTEFSLILNDNNTYGDTIYTKFHSNKYKRYRESEILYANIIMTDVDWINLQINQPVEYDKQIYSIQQITNYDVSKATAEITLIKML